MRTMNFKKSELKVLEFFKDFREKATEGIYELPIDSDENFKYKVNYYTISQSLISTYIKSDVLTTKAALVSLSEKKIIKFETRLNAYTKILYLSNFLKDIPTYIRNADIIWTDFELNRSLKPCSKIYKKDVFEMRIKNNKYEEADIDYANYLFDTENKTIKEEENNNNDNNIISEIVEQNKEILKELKELSKEVNELKVKLNSDKEDNYILVGDKEANTELTIIDNEIVESELPKEVVLFDEANLFETDKEKLIDIYFDDLSKRSKFEEDEAVLSYFNYIKKLGIGFYNKYYISKPKFSFISKLNYVADLFTERFTLKRAVDSLVDKDNYKAIDKSGFVTYFLHKSGILDKFITYLPIKPSSVRIDNKFGLSISYNSLKEAKEEPKDNFYYNLALNRLLNNLDRLYWKKEKFNLLIKSFIDTNHDDIKDIMEDLYNNRHGLYYSIKLSFLKLCYLSLKRSQTKKRGLYTLSSNSFYIKDNKKVMHKATELIIKSVNYSPFVKQLLIDYTEWVNGGGVEWIQEITDYIIPKKRLKTISKYKSHKDGKPIYDIKTVEDELYEGHIISRIYEKLINSKISEGNTLGLCKTGLGLKRKINIPDYEADSVEYRNAFYSFIGLKRFGDYSYISINEISPIATDDKDYYKKIILERLFSINAKYFNRIFSEITKEEKNKLKVDIERYNNIKADSPLDYYKDIENLISEEGLMEGIIELGEDFKEYLSIYIKVAIKLLKELNKNIYSLETLKYEVAERLRLLENENKITKDYI